MRCSRPKQIRAAHILVKTEQVRQQATLLRRLDREAYKKEMSKLKVQKNRIFDLSMDMICILGFDGRFQQLNPSWEETLGFKVEEFKGTLFFQWIHPEDQDATRAAWAQLKNRGSSLSFENRGLCKDGSLKWLLWSVAVYPQEKLVYAVVRDITQRKKEEDQVRELNAQLELKVEKRTEELHRTIAELEAFSYSVSHDLRAPLRIIDGYSRMLLEDHVQQLSEEGRRVVDSICGTTQRMTRLVNDLLAFSKISREEIVPDNVDMNELVGLVIEELRASNASVKAKFEIGELPSSRGDRAMIRQVLTNLLSNAVKYSRHTQEAKIQVGARTEGDRNIYHVRDSGVGFDMKYAAKLFRVFSRLHSQQEFEGTGVGLAIVEQVVHRHGGRVWAQAQVNEGATFYFTLPKGRQGL
jgi:PAS domain S-box-containing protein